MGGTASPTTHDLGRPINEPLRARHSQPAGLHSTMTAIANPRGSANCPSSRTRHAYGPTAVASPYARKAGAPPRGRERVPLGDPSCGTPPGRSDTPVPPGRRVFRKTRPRNCPVKGGLYGTRWSFDRLARSLPDARDIADEFTAARSSSTSADPYTTRPAPSGACCSTSLAMGAEFAADPIRTRTREGMKVARARARGRGRLRGKQPELSAC